MKSFNKLDLSEMIFNYVVTRKSGVRLKTLKGCTFRFTRIHSNSGAFIKGISAHRESGFLHNRKEPFEGKFFKEEFLRWLFANTSIVEMYKVINQIDGLVYPD